MSGKFEYSYYGEYNDSSGSMLITIDDIYNILNKVVPKLFIRIEEKIAEKEFRIFVPTKLMNDVSLIVRDMWVRVVSTNINSKNFEITKVEIQVLSDDELYKQKYPVVKESVSDILDFHYYFEPKIEHLGIGCVLERILDIIRKQF